MEIIIILIILFILSKVIKFFWGVYTFGKYENSRKTFIDSKTGKPLTQKQWSRKMDEFNNLVDDLFDEEDEKE